MKLLKRKEVVVDMAILLAQLLVQIIHAAAVFRLASVCVTINASRNRADPRIWR